MEKYYILCCNLKVVVSMIKNVIINRQIYQIDLKQGIKGKTNGICYQLKTEEEDLAVKIFYLRADRLSEKEIEVFKTIESEVHPIVISKYPVFDTQGQYIGSASSFIHEDVKQESKNRLYQLEKEFLLENLGMIQEKLPIFDQHHILLNNLGIHNLLIGRGTRLPHGIYLINDSYDMLATFDTEFHNQKEFYRFLCSIIKYHLVTIRGFEGEEEDITEYLNQFMNQLMDSRLFYETIPQLEKKMASFSTLQEYLDDYYETGFRKKYQMIGK